MEVYYARETDANTRLVSQLRHHGSTMIHVGDVYNLIYT